MPATEGLYAEVMGRLEKSAKNIENGEVRSRQMARKLKSVEALPSEGAQPLVGAQLEAGDGDTKKLQRQSFV